MCHTLPGSLEPQCILFCSCCCESDPERVHFFLSSFFCSDDVCRLFRAFPSQLTKKNDCDLRQKNMKCTGALLTGYEVSSPNQPSHKSLDTFSGGFDPTKLFIFASLRRRRKSSLDQQVATGSMVSFPSSLPVRSSRKCMDRFVLQGRIVIEENGVGYIGQTLCLRVWILGYLAKTGDQ